MFINDYPRFILSLENINSMIGLETTKNQVADQVKSFMVNYRRSGKPTNGEMLHTLIYGPPGCGKTQLGEYLAELWATSGCLALDDGTPLFSTTPNESSSPVQKLFPSIATDTEKETLRRSLIFKDSQIKQLQERVRRDGNQASRLITEFNNIRKKIKADSQLQSRLQKFKEGIKLLVPDSPNNSTSDPPGSPEILPVTVPKAPGVRSYFGKSNPPLAASTSLSRASSFGSLPRAPSLPFIEKEKRPVKFVRLTRGDFISKYQGHTTDNVRKILSKYVGGVVMIDEAYTLCTSARDDFGKELLSEIVNFMSTYPDKIIFIFAGYRKDIEDGILKFQPGLNRRFNWTFEISSYNAKELSLIFQQQIKLAFPKDDVRIKNLKRLDELFDKQADRFPHFGGDTQRFTHYLKELMSSKYWQESLDDSITKEEFINLFKEIDHSLIKESFEKYLANMESGWKNGENMVPLLMDALQNKVTMGECHEAMRTAQSWSFR